MDVRRGENIPQVDTRPFVDATVLSALGTLTREEADALPYGAIKLDDVGDGVDLQPLRVRVGRTTDC